MKRGLDVAIAGVCLVLAAPLLALLALLIRRRLGSPIVFRQVRPGLDRQPFTMPKFRTMTDERDATGALLPDEERLTPFGEWLRRTSVDELPELVSVLRGEMSLVGPRPLLMDYLDLYSPRQDRRHEVRPGMTGWAQVNGRNRASWQERLEMDVWYVDNRSLWLDLRILARTVVNVVLRRDISAEGHATAPKFTGSSDD